MSNRTDKTNRTDGAPLCRIRPIGLIRPILVVAVLLFAAAAQAQELSVGDYVSRLERLHSLLRANQLTIAQDEAHALAKMTVRWSGGTFHTDSALLNDIGLAKRAEQQLVLRLGYTIDALRHDAPRETGAADQKALADVAAAQAVPEYAPGGTVPTRVQAEIPMLERVVEAIAAALQWLGEKIGKILDWLLDLLPRKAVGEAGATSGMRALVIGLAIVIALVIALLAVQAIRRARKREDVPLETSEPIGSKRDEDPLSRGATEWEKYAVQLAASGRLREAIRAWYHAVLVTCYADGVLHYKKGRTNWEYIAALAPSYGWRPELIALTRRFEQEWYGSLRSTAEAHDECSRRARNILDALRRKAA